MASTHTIARSLADSLSSAVRPQPGKGFRRAARLFGAMRRRGSNTMAVATWVILSMAGAPRWLAGSDRDRWR